MLSLLTTAQAVTRGVCRTLTDLGYGTLTEMRVGGGRRVDVMAINRDGEIVVVEVKSCEADFQSDGKWPEYLGFCDRFYFAVAEGFPLERLPGEQGLMVADAYAAVVHREGPALKLHPSRRRSLTLAFALAASGRLHSALDPRL